LPLPGEFLGEDEDDALFEVKDRFNVCDSRTKACPFDDDATRADVVGSAIETGRLPLDASLEVDSFRNPDGDVDCLRVLLSRILLVGKGMADCSILDCVLSGAEAAPSKGDSTSSSGRLPQLRALATLIRC
jgi:hypothetical protein